MIKRIIKAIKSFKRDTRGSYSVEAMLVLPALIWANVGTYTFFDAFNAVDTNLKAAYTMSDMISRQKETVTPAYINGMNSLFDYLNRTSGNTWIRVTVITYDTPSKSYKVTWSYATHNEPLQTDTTINKAASKLPTIVAGDSLIVVETHLYYTPPFDMGLAAQSMDQFVVTRPRLGPQVVYSSS